MKTYTIQKVNAKPTDWEGIEKVSIDTYMWSDTGYEPRVLAALCYDEEAIYVKFWAYEPEVRAFHRVHNASVCEDSCVEFFFRPNSDPNFFNIETSVIGTQLIGFGSQREDRLEVPVDEAVMQIVPSVKDAETYTGDMWTMEYRVPFSFLKKYYGDLDIVSDGLRANLYKCGDLTRYEHYGMWNPVYYLPPDFHRPEYFGAMVFER